MAPGKPLLLFLWALLLVVSVAGCGSGSSSRPTPQGGFTNASLNGTYAISFSGSNGSFFAVAGSLTLDGNGHITSGVIDDNVSPPLVNLPVTGTYNVHPDGRGVAGLVTSAGTINMVFVIVGGNRALVTRFDQSATGSGSMDLQTASAFSTSALAGTFVFNLAGLGASGNPAATVGSITIDSAGNITSGIQDQSDNGAVSQNVALAGATLQVAGNGRGTATINMISGQAHFAFYVVDANRLKMVETDRPPALAGDAFRQSGAISNASLNGPFAFTVSGSDAGSLPLATGGVFTTNGAGAISLGTFDRNDGGTLTTNVATTGSYSVAANGRGTATMTGNGLGTLDFAIYPTSNGVQMLQTDTGLVVSGAAFQQSGSLSTATITGTYGLNMSAATFSGELDSVASLNANGTGHVTGITDINNVGSLSTGSALTANYTVDVFGRGPLTIQTPLGQQNMAMYTLSGSRAIFIELDPNIVAVGAIEHQ